MKKTLLSALLGLLSMTMYAYSYNQQLLPLSAEDVDDTPAYYGNMYRIGYSHQYVQSLTQNAVHKFLVKTPFFLGTDHFYKGLFSYSGYYSPLSLW